MLRRKWLWLIVFAYILFILSNSAQTGEVSGRISGEIAMIGFNFLEKIGIHVAFDTLHFLVRKLAHFSEFFLLGILVQTAQKHQPICKNDLLVAMAFMLLIPLLDEGLQLFIEGRAGSIRDSLIDMSGYLISVLLFQFINKKKS